MDIEFEHQVRQAAFAFLDAKTSVYGDVLGVGDLSEGIAVGGTRIALLTIYKGIFKARQLDAALSILTTPPKASAPSPYDDHFGGDGLFRYHYRGDDPTHPDNKAVRAAMQNHLPLIYFFGIVPGRYLPLWPVHVVGEDAASGFFHLDLTGMAIPETLSSASEDTERRYRSSIVRHRLHQAKFRQAVIRAYQSSCAICRLRRVELVDAAHIISDAEGGSPEVPNGLALCKLHHAAFDRHILGVRPDLTIVLRHDLLEEHDGPMLVHGLQEFHGGRIVVPTRAALRPSAENLERRYERFRSAG